MISNEVKEKFSDLLETIKTKYNCTYVEAMVKICNNENLELSFVVNYDNIGVYLTKDIKERIRNESKKYNTVVKDESDLTDDVL